MPEARRLPPYQRKTQGGVNTHRDRNKGAENDKSETVQSSKKNNQEADHSGQDTSENNMQIPQIHDIESVSMEPTVDQRKTETEASNWVNSHILELSNTSNTWVAFMVFEKETLALLMRLSLDERKAELDKKEEGKDYSTPRNKRIGKNELKNLKSTLKELLTKIGADVYCFQETKINKNVEGVARMLWPSTWMKCQFMKTEGSRGLGFGGVLIMWDSRTWEGALVETGHYSITIKFKVVQSSFTWLLSHAYAPHKRSEKLECWEDWLQSKNCLGGHGLLVEILIQLGKMEDEGEMPSWASSIIKKLNTMKRRMERMNERMKGMEEDELKKEDIGVAGGRFGPVPHGRGNLGHRPQVQEGLQEGSRRKLGIFQLNELTQHKKAAHAIAQLERYASTWWETKRLQRARNGNLDLPDWDELKALMKENVEEYYEEFQNLILRLDIVEPPNHCTAQFKGGLDYEAVSQLVVHKFDRIEDLVEAAIEVERNIHAKRTFNKGYQSSTSSGWNKNKDSYKPLEKKPIDTTNQRYLPRLEGNPSSTPNSKGSDSRSNLFQEGEDDTSQRGIIAFNDIIGGQHIKPQA
ncbi:hypothetical protein FXO37_02115 [Capsicum annuum]|nr:hypothetical protein FXO37_02115 [Capsicum annuum]